MTDTARTGTIVVDGDDVTMTFRRRLPYPIDAVWAAITDPTERAVWLGRTTIDARADGTIETMPDEPPAAPDAKRMTGRILTWRPPAGTPRSAVLEHEWHQRIVEDGVVRYALTEDGGGTLLEFTHRGLSLRNAQGFLPGEHAFLDRMEAHLAGEEPPDCGRRYEEVAPAYA